MRRGPWPEVGDRGGGGGPFPGEEGLADGGGGVLGQELAEIYLGVGAVVDGDGRSRGSGGAPGAAAAAVAGGGAPAREEGQGQAGELHGALRKLQWGLIWAGAGRSREFRGGRAAGGVHDGGGGVPRHWEAPGGIGRAWEWLGGEMKLVGCSVGVEEC